MEELVAHQQFTKTVVMVVVVVVPRHKTFQVLPEPEHLVKDTTVVVPVVVLIQPVRVVVVVRAELELLEHLPP
jgi:hypothetical protein